MSDGIDVTPPNEYGYILKNSTYIDGGSAAESTESIRRHAPDYVRTADRAVTKHDYEFWTKRSAIGGITDAVAYGEEELGTVITHMNNVYVTYLTDTASTLSLSELTELRKYIDAYKTITTQVIYAPAEVILLQINVDVKRNNQVTASNSEIYDFVNDSLRDMFKFSEGSIGKPLYYSDIVEAINLLTITRNGKTARVADYVNVDIKLLKSFSSDGSTTPDVTIPPHDLINAQNQDMVVAGSVEIVNHDNSLVIATDDGAGNINNGTIDYKTGVISGYDVLGIGNYYIRYSIDGRGNAFASPTTVLGYSEPKEKISDTDDLFSTIGIL